jgi:hypothetical protein
MWVERSGVASRPCQGSAAPHRPSTTPHEPPNARRCSPTSPRNSHSQQRRQLQWRRRIIDVVVVIEAAHGCASRLHCRTSAARCCPSRCLPRSVSAIPWAATVELDYRASLVALLSVSIRPAGNEKVSGRVVRIQPCSHRNHRPLPTASFSVLGEPNPSADRR